MYDIQKASVFKRFSAYLFDIILVAVISVGLAVLFTMILGFDANLEEYRGYYAEYEEKYNIKITGMTTEEYEALTDEEKAIYDAAGEEFENDERIIKVYSLMINKIMITLTFSILIAYAVWEFIIPLILKNGQTLGKKIFGICVMHVNSVKVSPLAMFARSILGKYTIGTMIPIYMIILIMANAIGIVGVFVVLAILVLQVVLIIFTKTNSAIHDVLSQTVVVDYSTQMIFNSREELIEYQKQKAADAAARAPYFNGNTNSTSGNGGTENKA